MKKGGGLTIRERIHPRQQETGSTIEINRKRSTGRRLYSKGDGAEQSRDSAPVLGFGRTEEDSFSKVNEIRKTIRSGGYPGK